MKFKHLLIIALTLLAIGYTTSDRLSDAGEIISAQQAHHQDMSYDTNHNELFCDFPMVAKASFTLADLSGSTSVTTNNIRSKPALHNQERFRPPAYTAV